MKIEFSVSVDDTITVEELEAGLKSGKFASDNECEYFDYKVSEG